MTPFQRETNLKAFEQRLSEIESALTSKETLIDADLKPVSKFGFWWYALSVARPFFAFFGRDVYSHVRIEKVAERSVEFCKANQAFLWERRGLSTRIVEKIITPLTEKIARCEQKRKIDPEWKERIQEVLLPRFMENQSAIKKPENLTELRIVEGEWLIIEKAVEKTLKILAANPSTNVAFEKVVGFCLNGDKKGAARRISLSQGSEKYSIQVPYSLYFQKEEGRWIEIVLITKSKLKADAKKAYGLFSGRAFVLKNMKGEAAGRDFAVDYLKSNPYCGIVPIDSIRRVNNKKQLMELSSEGTLEAFLAEQASKWDVQTQQGVIADLLFGLKHFHEVPGALKVSFLEGSLVKIASFHANLHPGNIEIFLDEGAVRACMTGFETCWRENVFMGRSGYLPSEMIGLEKRAKKEGIQAAYQFFAEYGQAVDVWAMGLILVAILKKEDLSQTRSPLNCIHQLLEGEDTNGSHLYESSPCIEAPLQNLTQEEIDEELELLKQSVDPAHSPLIERVIKQMLQVMPSQRMTAAEAVEISQSLDFF